MTKPHRLSRCGGELLLRILERSKPVTAVAVLQGLPSDLLPDLIKIGALEKCGTSGVALVLGDEGPAFRDLVWQAERNAYGYFDASDGTVALEPES